MVDAPFLFSNRLNQRLWRHFVFWLSWYVFQVFLYAFVPSPLTALNLGARLELSAGESLLFLIPNFFLAYSLMYWVIPKMIVPARYIRALFWTIVVIILTGAISSLLSLTIIDYFRHYFLHGQGAMVSGSTATPLNIKIFLAFIAGLRGSITIGGMAAAIKLMKYFYEKQKQALLLLQQNTIAELNSLKAQLHPHFLFNTLNNIFSFAQGPAPVAADMIHGLSELLRYMLYTSAAPFVPLSEEITMMQRYIALERMRYGNSLEVSVEVPEDTHGLIIAPLLILPFIENCFKHGTSGMLENPWITIRITIRQTLLHMTIVNGKHASAVPTSGGIGIDNIKRRLALVYPDNYRLGIVSEADIHVVNLQIELTSKHDITHPL